MGGGAGHEWWPLRETTAGEGESTTSPAPALGQRHRWPRTSRVRLSESHPTKIEALEPLAHGRRRLEKEAVSCRRGPTARAFTKRRASDSTLQTNHRQGMGRRGEGWGWSGKERNKKLGLGLILTRQRGLGPGASCPDFSDRFTLEIFSLLFLCSRLDISALRVA